MVLETQQLQFVQRQLDYRFEDVSRLVPCFKAAHRDAHDGVVEDGNRALAQLGVTIMEMIEKRSSSMVRTEPRCVAQQRAEWASSKEKRAAACDDLNFTPLIQKSVRQGDQKPSKNVRAATVSAIVAAVFEDLCARRENIKFALEKIADLLNRLGACSLGSLSIDFPDLTNLPDSTHGLFIWTAGDTAGFDFSATEVESFDVLDFLHVDPQHAGLGEVRLMERNSCQFDLLEWTHIDEAEENGLEPQPSGSLIPNDDLFVLSAGQCGTFQVGAVPQLVSPQSSDSQSGILPTIPASSCTTTHQPSEPRPRLAAPQACHLLKLDEEIGRTIDEPFSKDLRTIFNYLGSSQSIMTFKRALNDLRARKNVDNIILGGARSSADNLRIVKRLRESSAADSLLTMYHIVKLFEDEIEDLVHPPGTFMIQTQTNFGGYRTTSTGNPLSIAKAAVTDQKMELLYPHLSRDSEEYRVERQYVKKLQQSAAKFVLFCNAFGFGILAFLPYADSFGTNCSLNRLMAIPEIHISRCITILQRFQPDHLCRLGAAAEPIMESLVNGKFWSSNPSKIEQLEERVILTFAKESDETYDVLF